MLKRGRKSAQAATTTPTFTDEDRIRAQLKLDVSELAAKVRQINVNFSVEKGRSNIPNIVISF